MLVAALTDVGGSVRANDQKAAAALVVHGLLFAGVINVAVKLGPIYKEASSLERYVGLALIIVAGGAFLISVVSLLLAVLPYRPLAIAQDLGTDYKGVFFPDVHELAGCHPKTGSRSWFTQRLSVSVLPGFRGRNLYAGRQPGTHSPLLEEMRQRVESMDDGSVNIELMAEILKIKDILDWESGCARWGYRFLMIELVAVVPFFLVVTIVGLNNLK